MKTGFVFFSHTLCAKEFPFPNGSRIVTGDDVGAVYFSPEGDSHIITDAVVRYHPTGNQPLDSLLAEDAFWMVSQDGAITRVNANYDKLQMFPEQKFPGKEWFLSWGGYHYYMVSLPYKDEYVDMDREIWGETYLLRSDGKQILVDNQFHTDAGFPFSQNGVLLVSPTVGVDLKEMKPIDPVNKTARSVWNFDSGKRLVVTQRGERSIAYTIAPNSRKGTPITRDTVIAPHAFSATADRLWPITILQAQSEVYAMSTSGRDYRFPLVRTTKRDPSGEYQFDKYSFDYQGMSHALVSFPYEDPDRYNNGETFIIREDGVVVRIDFDHHSLGATTVHISKDGFLTINSCDRTIDLDHLRGEARFPIVPRSKVEDANGQTVDNLDDFVFSRFSNLTESVAASTSQLKSLTPEVLDEMRIALVKPERGSVVLLGEAGSGKTVDVKDLVRRIRQGEYPELPRTIHVPVIDPATLSQGTKWVGSIESYIKALIEFSRRKPTLLFMDEIHSLVGAGVYAGNPANVFQQLKTGMAEGTVRVLATDTENEFYAAYGGDVPFLQRIQVVKKGEPKNEAVMKAVAGWAKAFNFPVPAKDVLEATIEYSNDFGAAGSQPSKATALFEHVVAQKIQKGTEDKPVTLIEIAAAAQSFYQIDPLFFDPEKRCERLQNLPRLLDEAVVGQGYLKKELIKLARQFLAGVHDRTKPAIRMLVAGPRGVGKTESAKAYAHAMGLPFVRIEMNRYATGTPRQFLAEVAMALRKNAFSVIVLDEFEKANQYVQQAVLAMFDSGSFTVEEDVNKSDGGGQWTKISALNATFIATTNAGSEFISRQLTSGGFGFRPEAQTLNDDEGSAQFKDAVSVDGIPNTVVDRFQVVAAAQPPTIREFESVLKLHVDRAVKDIAARQRMNIQLDGTEQFVEVMAKRYFQSVMSNRVSHVVVQEHIRTALAEALLNRTSKTPKGAVIHLRFDNATGAFTDCRSAIASAG